MDHADSRLPPRLLASTKLRESEPSPKPRCRKTLSNEGGDKKGNNNDDGDGAEDGGDAAGAELMGAF